MKMNFDKRWNMAIVCEQLMQLNQTIPLADLILSVRSLFEKETTVY